MFCHLSFIIITIFQLLLKKLRLMLKRQHSFSDFYKASKPSPVLNFDKKLAVFFSAKSGCTFLVKWFFFQIGHLTAALDFNHFVHNYREKVYLNSDHFTKSENNFINTKGKDYLKIKVVRNPFERAVSSYIHFLGMLDKQHPEINNNFGIGYEKMNYSFADFLNLLSTINVNKCNVHWRQQYQLIERRLKFDHIIDLNNSTEELLKLEDVYKLKKTSDITSLVQSGHHSSGKKTPANQQFCGYTAFAFAVKKNRPDYKYFYNAALENQVRQIYQVDFEKYQFDLNYL